MTKRDGGQRFLALLGAIVAALYLLNPTLGIFEIVPDNLPIVGNLDEAGAAALLFACVRKLRRRGGESEDAREVTVVRDEARERISAQSSALGARAAPRDGASEPPAVAREDARDFSLERADALERKVAADAQGQVEPPPPMAAGGTADRR